MILVHCAFTGEPRSIAVRGIDDVWAPLDRTIHPEEPETVGARIFFRDQGTSGMKTQETVEEIHALIREAKTAVDPKLYARIAEIADDLNRIADALGSIYKHGVTTYISEA